MRPRVDGPLRISALGGAVSENETTQTVSSQHKAYWRENLKIVFRCLAIWFIASYGFGILLVDVLNRFSLGGFPLGFWFAQQGSIFIFIGLIAYYVYAMSRLDRRFDVDEE